MSKKPTSQALQQVTTTTAALTLANSRGSNPSKLIDAQQQAFVAAAKVGACRRDIEAAERAGVVLAPHRLAFDLLDTDGNGDVSSAEYLAAGRSYGAYKATDTDQNDRVSWSEFREISEIRAPASGMTKFPLNK